MRRRLTGLIAVLTALGLMIPAVLASTTVTVSTTQMQGWAFAHEGAGPGEGGGDMVFGPGNPPLGQGSASLVLEDGLDGWTLGKADYQGVRLADLNELVYYTYVESASGPSPTITLQFNFTLDVTDDALPWQGRITFEPYLTNPANPVEHGEWQEWDALSLGGWWATDGTVRSLTGCSQSYAGICTLQDIIDLYPNAGVHPTLGAVLFKAGSGWDHFDGNVDAFTIGVEGASTTYNFEPDPADKDDCKQGGYADFGFDSQGLCIQYVNTGKDSR